MPRIEGRRSRIMTRHLVELAISAVFMGTIFTLAVYVWHWSPGVTIGAAIGFPVAAHSVGGLIGAAIRTNAHNPPVVSWDQDGITYLSGNMEDDVQLRWTDLQEYGFTWEYPVRLKMRRLGGRPFRIPLSAFSDDDRARLLAELAIRVRALPNQRL